MTHQPTLQVLINKNEILLWVIHNYLPILTRVSNNTLASGDIYTNLSVCQDDHPPRQERRKCLHILVIVILLQSVTWTEQESFFIISSSSDILAISDDEVQWCRWWYHLLETDSKAQFGLCWEGEDSQKLTWKQKGEAKLKLDLKTRLRVWK